MPSHVLPLAAAAGALLLLSGKKKKKKSTSIVFDDGDTIIGGEPKASTDGVTFLPDLNKYDVGPMWTFRVLDPWLNEQRKAGKLLTVNHNEGWLYELLIENPTTFLGDITGLGKTGGSVIYGGLWLMATAGIGIYASGFASAGANIQAATQAASATRAMQILGPEATKLAGVLYHKGFAASQIALALADFGGTQQMAKFGVSKAIVAISAGAAGLGASMSAALLAETGINAAFSGDLAASATEAAGEFMMNHKANVGGVMIPLALLPSGDRYPAVQEFNKQLMNYIIKFQKRTFED